MTSGAAQALVDSGCDTSCCPGLTVIAVITQLALLVELAFTYTDTRSELGYGAQGVLGVFGTVAIATDGTPFIGAGRAMEAAGPSLEGDNYR